MPEQRTTPSSSSSAGKPRAVTSSTSYLLVLAGVLVGRAIDEALTPHGLTGRQYLLLSTVAEHEVQSQLELSRQMLLDPTIVVALIDDLERRGLVTRSRHPEDRRRHLVALTSDGKVLRKRAMAALGTAERSFLSGLDATERQQLQAILRRVTADKPAH